MHGIFSVALFILPAICSSLFWLFFVVTVMLLIVCLLYLFVSLFLAFVGGGKYLVYLSIYLLELSNLLSDLFN